MTGRIMPPNELPAPAAVAKVSTDGLAVDRPISSTQSSPGLPAWIQPRLHTVEEAAVLLHLSRQVRRLVAEGRLAVVRIGRAVRVSPEVLASLVTGRDGR